MTLTVLEIAQNVCYEIGVPAPSSILSATDPNQLQLKNLLCASARSLRESRIFPQAKRKFEFVCETNISKYPLPMDYFAALQDTKWDEISGQRLFGPVSDAFFTNATKGNQQFTWRTMFRIFGAEPNSSSLNEGQFEIWPVPTANGTPLYFEFITSTLFLPAKWQPSTAVLLNALRSVGGRIYKCTVAGTTSTTPPIHQTGTAADGTVTWAYQDISNEQILADTDFSIYDDDNLIAELKWRWLRAKGEDYQEEQSQANKQLDIAVARWNGNFTGSFSGPIQTRRYSFPPGGWTF